MKRIRQQPVACDVDWTSLNGDLVRELVRIAPPILPALYLLSKHFHTALATASPNAPFWQAYFNRKLGYSNYTPNKDTDLTWKVLVAMQKQGLCNPTYYLLTKRAQFECGAFAPSGLPHDLECSVCGALFTKHVIKEWVPKKRTILCVHPERVVNGTKLRPLCLAEILTTISSYSPGYFWDPSRNAILFNGAMGLLLPGALPANEVALLGERAWGVEQFDAVV